MPCPECGVQNAADHNYCKHCGPPLREVDLERELGTGFAERTRDRCLQLLKADPQNPSAHYNLGLAYYHLGSIGNAIRAFEKTVAFDDAYPGAHFQLAVCHYRRGAMSECARAARRAIELNPRSAPARYRLAMALFHLGKLHDAARAFTETLEADRVRDRLLPARRHPRAPERRRRRHRLLRARRPREPERRLGALPPRRQLQAEGPRCARDERARGGAEAGSVGHGRGGGVAGSAAVVRDALTIRVRRRAVVARYAMCRAAVARMGASTRRTAGVATLP